MNLQKSTYWKFVAWFLTLIILSIGVYAALSFRSGGNFFTNAVAIISETFGDVFGLDGRGKLVAEIELGDGSNRTAEKLADDSGSRRLQQQAGFIAQNLALVAAPQISKKQSDPETDSQKSEAPQEPVLSKSDSGSQSAATYDQADTFLAENVSGNPAVTPDCSFASGNNPSREVTFNELAWMGSPKRDGETSTAAANNEWIELKNNSVSTADLSGWQILNDAEKFRITFDGGEKISAGGFYLLERTDDDSVPGVTADKIYKGALLNSGMWLRIFSSQCALVDEINASGGSTGLTTSGWPAGDNSTKQTLARNAGDFGGASLTGWHTSADSGGTPNAQNSEAQQTNTTITATTYPSVTQYNVSVSMQGDGSGVVTSDPAGINCGLDCQEEYSEGATIVLGAAPSENSSFESWSGACSGAGMCDLIVGGPLAVIANFKLTTPPPSYSPPPPDEGGSGGGGTGNVLISEIFYDAEGGDAGKEFVELYNPTTSEIDLDGWSLKKGTNPLASIGSKSADITIVKAGGFFLVGLNSYSGSPTADVVRSATLPNTTATINLLDASGGVVESVTYSNSVSPGESYERASSGGSDFAPQSNPNPQNSSG